MIRLSTSFLDIIFNLCIIMSLLFFLSFLQISEKDKKAELEKPKAEFIIRVSWNDNSNNDVDTYIQAPNEEIVYYRNKETAMVNLDRDDLGFVNETITLPNNEQIKCPHNEEYVTIRGVIPGKWILNVHMYRNRDNSKEKVNVLITKLNPVAKVIFKKTVFLLKEWQEENILIFYLDKKGNVTKLEEKNIELVKKVTTLNSNGGVNN